MGVKTELFEKLDAVTSSLFIAEHLEESSGRDLAITPTELRILALIDENKEMEMKELKDSTGLHDSIDHVIGSERLVNEGILTGEREWTSDILSDEGEKIIREVRNKIDTLKKKNRRR